MKPAPILKNQAKRWYWGPLVGCVLGTLVIAPQTLCAAGDDTTQTRSLGPRIHFAEPTYDFGKVIAGQAVKHEFVFTNTGDQNLILTQVRSSCGCTTLTNWSRQVEPAQRGMIPVELHTANFNGPINKPVIVVCNDTNKPLLTLLLKGTIWRPVEAIPQAVGFSGVFDTPTNTTKIVRIVNNQDQPLSLSPPRSSHRAFTAELKTNQPGKEYELVVRVVPPLGSGNAFGEITLKTSSTHMPELKISTWAVAVQPVVVSPAQLMLPAGPFASSLMRMVTIRNMGSNPLALKEPMINVKDVGLELKEIQAGRYFSLVLNFPQGFQLAPQEKAELNVKSSHPQFALIKVPIHQLPALASSAPSPTKLPTINVPSELTSPPPPMPPGFPAPSGRP